MWSDMQANGDSSAGMSHKHVASLLLLFFIAISIYMSVGDPPAVAVLSLGLGYAFGWGLLEPAVRRWALIAVYAGVVAGTGILLGRYPALSIVTGLGMGVVLWVLTTAGDRLGLRRLREPADAAKLLALAALMGLLVPTVTAINANLLGRTSYLPTYAPQAALTGVTGVLLTGALVLSYEPHGYVVRGLKRQVELFALMCFTVFLLTGISLMDAATLAGAGPLFLLFITMGWLGVRFGPSIATIGVLASSIWITLGVTWGSGVFVSTTISALDAVLATQIYVSVLASGILLLSVYARYTREQATTARRSAELLSSAADSAATQVFLKHYDPQTDRFYYSEVNENFAAAVDKVPAEVVGLSDEDLHTPFAAARFHDQDMAVMTGGKRQRFYTNVTLNGRHVTFFASKFPIYDSTGAVVGVGGVSLDRTEERRRATMLQLVFARSPMATARLAWDSEGLGAVLEVNDAFAELVGLPSDEIVGRTLPQILTGEGDVFPLSGRSTHRREVRLRRRDAAELTVAATVTLVGNDSDEQFALVILEDVTATRAAEAGLVYRATHDPLTDMLNRQALVERLAARSSAGSVPQGTAVWCCDLDGFKHINDTLGHDTGDRVLLAMADRVRATVSLDDTVGRLGADEFVVVSGLPVDAQQAAAIGDQIRAAVAQPLAMDGRSHTFQVSVGVAISTGEVGAEELLRQADVALTRAKDLGRDRVALYQPELDRRVQLREAMRETLRKALSENRIDVQAQPVVDLDSGRTVGAEALVRLRDLDGTILPPAAFIGVAEDTGLIVPLGVRVLDLSLALCAQWAEQNTALEIAVNVSPRQLEDPDFATTVLTLLQVHKVAAEHLVLEVTESTVVDASGPTLQLLTTLREAGVHIAIDDFGTGYSSLASLRDLPADVVKIDRSFVSGLGVDSGDEAIVRAVLAMAHATDRIVVAEGVETRQQAQRLAQLNCDRVQGFWFSGPVPPIDFVPTRTFGAFASARSNTAKVPDQSRP